MSGFDDTYQAEVRAFHKYFPGDILPNHQFDDAIQVGADGKPYVDWVRFHQAKKLGVMHDRPVDYFLEVMNDFSTSPPSLTPSSAIHLFGLGDEITIGKDDVHLVSSG